MRLLNHRLTQVVHEQRGWRDRIISAWTSTADERQLYASKR
jgi:uncharacterized DUF497 family protein